MSRFARMIERNILPAGLDFSGSSPAAPEVVALAALVRACICDSVLARRVAETDSVDEVLDCLAADRLLMRVELTVEPDVLRAAPPGDLLRIVLDAIAREQART